MIDVELTADANGQFDLTVENGDLKAVSGFDTALLVSLLTDARASSTQVVLPERRRGWLGNIVSTVANRQLGSLLWLVDQRRLNQTTLNDTIDHVRNALNWLQDDNLVTNLEVTGSLIPLQGIQIYVTITALNGDTESHYINIWEVTGAT